MTISRVLYVFLICSYSTIKTPTYELCLNNFKISVRNLSEPKQPTHTTPGMEYYAFHYIGNARPTVQSLLVVDFFFVKQRIRKPQKSSWLNI